MRRLRARGGRFPRTREAGGPVRAHYGALPSMADADKAAGGESCSDDGYRGGNRGHPEPCPESTVPRSQIAAVARRKALRDCSFAADSEADRDKDHLCAKRRAATPHVSRGGPTCIARAC